MRGWIRGVLAVAAMAAGCDEGGSAGGDAGIGGMGGDSGVGGGDAGGGGEPVFASPQALAWAGERLLVTNIALNEADFSYGDGFVTVVDPQARRVVNTIPTSAKNPQGIAVHGDAAWVVDTGVLDFTDFTHPLGAEAGALDRLDLATLDTADAPSASVPVAMSERRDIAGPVEIAFVGDLGVLTFSIANVVAHFDASTGAFARGTDDPVRLDGDLRVMLGTVLAAGDRFYVLDFNADRLYVLDAQGQPWPCHVELGTVADQTEGAQLPRLDGDRLVFVMGVSGALRALDVSTLQRTEGGACGASEPETIVEDLGEVPNDLEVADGRAYVIDSVENNVKVFSLDDGAQVESWALEPGANPWHGALSPDGRWLAVSEWKGQAVTLIDVQSGETARVTGE